MPSLFVGNLPYAATNHDLEALFLQYQFQPKSVRIILDRETNRSRGFGFVELATADECARAKLQLDGGYFMDRQMNLRDADSHPPRSNNGPGARPARSFTPPANAKNGAPRFDDRSSKRDSRRQSRKDRERDRDDDRW